ncbi:MAG: peptidoglycan bridge formation glycyltransferase FemA/FemB family protein [Calditrichae bacterium]|nr:peptidoglycan bridge formation glycyltransferase FemA/FemB family protein [Calditrichia bacterium]
MKDKLNYTIINPIELDDWDAKVQNFKNFSIFHSSNWIKVLVKTYGFYPKSFVFEKNNVIKAIIPILEVNSIITGKRGVSLPFSDHCDILTNGDLQSDEIIEHVLLFAKMNKWDYVEFRSLNNSFKGKDSHFYLGHILKLSEDIDALYSEMKSANKRNIKKAIKENVKIEFLNSLDAMKQYYRLHSMTRKRQGVPPQSFEFFKNIYEEIILDNKGHIILGSIQDKVVAGAVFIFAGENVVYKFGASDYRFQNSRANNLLFWEAIKFYSEKGFKTLDFGRTDHEQDGLRQFKLSWGTDEKRISYFRYNPDTKSVIDNSHTNGKLQTKIFNMMPESMLKLIGSKLYKHMA